MGFPPTPINQSAELKALDELSPEVIGSLLESPSKAIVYLSASLALRGVDATGSWVGPEQARALHQQRMSTALLPHELRTVPAFIKDARKTGETRMDPRHIFAVMIDEGKGAEIASLEGDEATQAIRKADTKVLEIGTKRAAHLALTLGIL